ncbi:MAG: hypothetical protein RDU30_14140 [Desulfovibrionaceae bacterium]|nr:hypothetical protein [Desulfovibrionaceae bacterium]
MEIDTNNRYIPLKTKIEKPPFGGPCFNPETISATKQTLPP